MASAYRVLRRIGAAVGIGKGSVHPELVWPQNKMALDLKQDGVGLA